MFTSNHLFPSAAWLQCDCKESYAWGVCCSCENDAVWRRPHIILVNVLLSVIVEGYVLTELTVLRAISCRRLLAPCVLAQLYGKRVLGCVGACWVAWWQRHRSNQPDSARGGWRLTFCTLHVAELSHRAFAVCVERPTNAMCASQGAVHKEKCRPPQNMQRSCLGDTSSIEVSHFLAWVKL